MRILITADIHANLEAVVALPADYDEMIVLGDVVNYGPNPREVIEFVRENATLIIRGNHDHAIGFDKDPRCSSAFRAMATEMAAVTQRLLSDDDRAFLRGLPLKITTEYRDTYFHLCHAAPSDPLFAYLPPDAAEWKKEARAVDPGLLLVGHTHLQFEKELDGRTIVNPGSVGQPKSDTPQASYAIWEDGRLSFHSVEYDHETTVDKIKRLNLTPLVKQNLIEVLHNGTLSPIGGSQGGAHPCEMKSASVPF